MLAVVDGMNVAHGDPVPLDYWRALCEDEQEATAMFNIHVNRVQWANRSTGTRPSLG